jgi:hypothetical protein
VNSADAQVDRATAAIATIELIVASFMAVDWCRFRSAPIPVPKYIGATCKDNVCGVIGAYFLGEFVGNAPAGYYIVPRGWHLGAPPEPRQSKTIPPADL